MKFHFLFILLQCSVNPLVAQRLQIDWEENPSAEKLCIEEYKQESAVILKERLQLEFSYTLEHEPTCTKRIHKKILVNDEKGIEMYNKVKFTYNVEYPIVLMKARTILPNGNKIQLKPEAFKELKEENGSRSKLFALEGVEKGSIVEYVIHMRYPISFFGSNLMQDIIPTCSSEFEIVTPESLIFAAKGYQHVIVEKDTAHKEKRSVYAYTKNLPALQEEPFASFLPHFARVDYSLTHNLEGKGKNIALLTWDDAANNLYRGFSTFSEKEIKSVRKVLSENKEYATLQNEQAKIAFIEQYIKTNFIQQEYVDHQHAEEIEFILKNKVTTETGIKQLFSLFFIAENIPFEIGYTNDRMLQPFDYSFPNWDNLKNCLFYFTNSKQYLAPNEFLYRIPFYPATWCKQEAMFCKVNEDNDKKNAHAEKRWLDEFSASENYHNHDVKVHFDEQMDTAYVQITNAFQGYNAIELLPLFIFLEDEKREEAVKQIIRISDKEEKTEVFTYTNNSFTSITERKPLTVSTTIHATNIVEKAGNKYLFKIGDLIGRQSELYQEHERQFDMEIPNPHQYTRTIHVKIPEGYTVNNLQKLKMNIVSTYNGKETCKFTSDYNLHGNELHVTIFEIYTSSFTPKSEYESYRKVINAAADFNKIALVFEKQ